MKNNTKTEWIEHPVVPRYGDKKLERMVQMAKVARTQNISRKDIIQKTIEEKARFIQDGVLQFSSMCSGGQIRPANYSVLEQMNLGLKNTTVDDFTDGDIQTGLMMFTTMVYCSEPVALSQFLHSLLSTQSPRTIIRAIVNTIQSNDLKAFKNRMGMNQFYLALDKIFHFQFGKILQATASPSELQVMISNDRPYFSHYSQEIHQCLNNNSCQGIRNLTTTLGKPEKIV